MIIRITDIPPEGRELEFTLDCQALNARTALAHETRLEAPEYKFIDAPRAQLALSLEGTTVQVKGQASSTYQTPCARCIEPTEKALETPIDLIIKPASERSRAGEEVEDLQLSFYDGKEINLAPIIEEALILSLPYTVICKTDCRGLCPKCGTNLNLGICDCKEEAEEKPVDPRWAKLKELKLH